MGFFFILAVFLTTGETNVAIYLTSLPVSGLGSLLSIRSIVVLAGLAAAAGAAAATAAPCSFLSLPDAIIY